MSGFRTDISCAPAQCLVILCMGRDPKSGRHHDVVCEASRDERGIWSGNAMTDIGPRIRAWAPLPSWYGKPDGPAVDSGYRSVLHGSGRKVGA